MGTFESKLQKPGVILYRIKGKLSVEDVEAWRRHLGAFVEENEKRGACGVVLDICEMDSLSAEAVDAVMELLSDPEEVIGDTRTRFALLGVRPFTKRFLRSAMPLTPVKHLRARFFHEVAEDEAVAWLSAMVGSAEDLPAPQPGAASSEKGAKPARAAEPEVEARKKPESDGKSKSARRLFGRDKTPKKGGSAAEAKEKLTGKSSEQKKGEAQKAAS